VYPSTVRTLKKRRLFTTPHTLKKKRYLPAHHEGVRESGDVAPRILKLGITWT